MNGPLNVQSPVLPPAETLDELASDIQRRLCGRVRDFKVLAQEQGLVLRGQAGTYYAKQLAQQAVKEASSLPILANKIEVT